MARLSETTKYTLYGTLFGLCFPVVSVVYLCLMNEITDTTDLATIIVAAHKNSLLYVIDSAPLFLGSFAFLAGVRQDRILQFSASLEQQVAEKTESLRLALEESRKANEMIAHMAEHDSLTGLLNRRRFQKELEKWGPH
jgi:predicted signal transduction protein with EAL and GGDEF domain